MPGHSFPGTGWIIWNLKIFPPKIFPWWISTCERRSDTFVMLSDPPRHFPPLLTHSQPSDPPWEGSPVICITLKTNCETMSRRQSTMQRAGLSLSAVVASSSENKTASSVSECPGQFYIRPFISHLQSVPWHQIVPELSRHATVNSSRTFHVTYSNIWGHLIST